MLVENSIQKYKLVVYYYGNIRCDFTHFLFFSKCSLKEHTLFLDF